MTVKPKIKKRAKVLSLALTSLLMAMLLLNLGMATTMALPNEPTDPTGDPSDWVIPTSGIEAKIMSNGYDWVARSRYTSGGGVVSNWYWSEAESRYNPEYIHPTGFRLAFNGCVNQADRDNSYNNEPTTYLYVWNVQGQTISQQNCYLYYQFPAQGDYSVSLTVKNTSGTIYRNTFTQNVTVKDLLVVAFGDSYGSGEGAPDIEKGNGQDAQWQSKRCHRSLNSAASKAAMTMEQDDPKTSVTFISFACSGATIDTYGYDTPSLWTNLNWLNYSVGDLLGLHPYDPGDPVAPVGSGMLGIYRGIEPVRDDHDTRYYLPSQIDQAVNALRIPGTNNTRPVDAVIMSAGGNDMGFSKIATVCFLQEKCYNHSVRNRFAGQAGQPDEVPLGTRIFQDFEATGAMYDRLDSAIRTQIKPKNIFITEYADSTTGDNGGRCIRILDDIFSIWPVYYPEVTQVEVNWLADTVVPNLNGTVVNAANRNGWTYVGGVSDAYRGHGYCASAQNRFINNADDSSNKQGGSATATTGKLHPNKKGYEAVANRITAYARPVLFNQGLPVTNASFEEPAVGPVGVWGSFQYAPATPGWSFVYGAGLAVNGSGFTNANPNAPHGKQVAFLQDAGSSATQTINVPAAGWYAVSFQAALRNYNASQTVRVIVDQTALGDFKPKVSYSGFTSNHIYLTAGSHSIKFTTIEAGDRSVFIDSVAVNPS